MRTARWCAVLLCLGAGLARADPPAPAPPATRDWAGEQRRIAGLIERQDRLLAEEAIERALTRPDLVPGAARPWLLRQRAEMAEAEGETARAIFWWEALRTETLPPGERIDVLLRLGRAYRTRGSIAAAQECFYAVFATAMAKAVPEEGQPVVDPDLDRLKGWAASAAFELAETSQTAGDLDRALELWERFLEQFGTEGAGAPIARLRRTEADFRAGRTDAAAEGIRALLRDDPAHPFRRELWVRLAALAFARERPDEALEAIARLADDLESAPPAERLYWQGRMAWQLTVAAAGDAEAQALLAPVVARSTGPGWDEARRRLGEDPALIPPVAPVDDWIVQQTARLDSVGR